MKWNIYIANPKSETSTHHVREYPNTHRSDGAAVCAYASREFKKPMRLILALPAKD